MDQDDLKDFKLTKVLNDLSDTKKIFLQGTFGDDNDQVAIVILEKLPFNLEAVEKLLRASSSLRTVFKNDIYGQFECSVEEPSLNPIKADVIYPAT